MTDNLLSSSDVDIVTEMLKQATVQEIDEQTKITWEQLKIAATSFIKAYQKLSDNESIYKKSVLKELINNPEQANYIKSLKGSDQAYFTRAKYLLAFDFDAKMTRFLEELPKEAIYVYEANNTLKTFVMPMKELAKYADKNGRLNIPLSQLSAEGRKAVEDTENGIIPKEHIEKAQAAYVGVNNRLNRFYEKAGLSGSKAQGGLLMWKKARDWQIARVSNRGDLKEAYVSFLMTQHNSKLDYLVGVETGLPEYYNHQLIDIFFNKYIYNVTNKPAIVKEDIIGEKAQYGVKSAKASMPTLQQYVATATWIAKQTSPVSKDELRAFIEERFNQDTHRNLIVTTASELTEKILNGLIKDFEDEILINF